MQALWAPWRMAYIGGPKPPGCFLCYGRDTQDRRDNLVLAQSPAVVMLNRFPYTNGHLLVAPRSHTAQLGGLSTAELHAVMEVVQRAATVLLDHFHAEGLNVGLNLGAAAGAGVADHLHWHLVPRWVGDTNFMTVLADVRVVPEHLEVVYDRLLPLFGAAAE
jgi:ATP adenylyltransferase